MAGAGAMAVWKTAAEWAELALPGVPSTKSAFIRRASSESWQRRKRAGRGGGFEYPLDSLPEGARTAYILSQARQAPAPAKAAPATPSPETEMAAREALWSDYERAPDGHREEAARRLKTIQTVEALIAAGIRKTEAVETVAGETGEHPATIRRWFALIKSAATADRLPALMPKWAGRTAEVECPEEAWDIIKGDYLRLSKPSFAGCYERLTRVAETRGWSLPSEKTLLRRIEREVHITTRILKREGFEALKRHYPAQQRDHAWYRAMEAVNADGHKFDVFCRWPDGTIGRPLGVFWQDIRSGKCLSYRVDKTENVDMVRLSFGDMVDVHGVPDNVYLDNGRGFASKWMTGQTEFRHRFKRKPDEPVGILTQLGINVTFTTPYHGQAKPIERMFRDFCDRVAKHPAFEGAYTGNNPTAKPENYGSRAVPIEEFLAILDQEVRFHNARTGRRSPVCGGTLSFDQAFEQSYQEALVRKITAGQRRLWLLGAEGVRSSKVDGAIHFMDNRYWSEALAQMAGAKLTIRFDPDHLHEGVHVYQAGGRYVGQAACVMAAGFGDTQAARAHARDMKAITRHWKAIAEAEVRMSAADVARHLPAPDPDAPAPETKVVRPIFGNTAIKVDPQPVEAGAEDAKEEFWENFGRNVSVLRERDLKDRL